MKKEISLEVESFCQYFDWEKGSEQAESLREALEKFYDAGSMEMLIRCIDIVQTHREGEELGYCDTGADMELQCRSECTNMATDRLRELL